MKIIKNLLIIIILCSTLFIMTGCGGNVKVNYVGKDSLKSEKGKTVTFCIPSGYSETDFLTKTEANKGYNNGDVYLGLQVTSSENKDTIKESLEKAMQEVKVDTEIKIEEVEINGTKYTKEYVYMAGYDKIGSCYFITELGNGENYIVYTFDSFDEMTENEINCFLNINY